MDVAAPRHLQFGVFHAFSPYGVVVVCFHGVTLFQPAPLPAGLAARLARYSGVVVVVLLLSE